MKKLTLLLLLTVSIGGTTHAHGLLSATKRCVEEQLTPESLLAKSRGIALGIAVIKLIKIATNKPIGTNDFVHIAAAAGLVKTCHSRYTENKDRERMEEMEEEAERTSEQYKSGFKRRLKEFLHQDRELEKQEKQIENEWLKQGFFSYRRKQQLYEEMRNKSMERRALIDKWEEEEKRRRRIVS